MSKVKSIEDAINADIAEQMEAAAEALETWGEFYDRLAQQPEGLPWLAQVNAFKSDNLREWAREKHQHCDASCYFLD